MNLFTIGFTQKSAKEFFELIQKYKIDLLLDIRLNNKSQLAGFSKGNDLKYFLSVICKCDYKHCFEFAPTKEILDDYKKNIISWEKYEELYNSLIKNRKAYENFKTKYHNYKNICLLCSEPTATKCHRRLAAEIINYTYPDIIIKHI